jgi:polysaccharide export outer membrane protein
MFNVTQFMTLKMPTLRLIAAMALLAIAGCSDLVPGININERSAGTHQYKVVRSEESTDFDVVAAGPVPTYEVIPITPDLLIALAKSQDRGDMNATPNLLPSDVPPEYKLGPGDVFFPIVWDHPELTTPYAGLTNDLVDQGRLVASDGTAFFPFVGKFMAAGMTMDVLRDYLATHLKGVIQNPQVDVRIVAFRAGRIEVAGEVMKPGTLNFNDTPMGVLQAIDLSGGLTPAASRRKAILERAGVVHFIDLAGLLSGSRLVPNPALKPGDVLHIPDQSVDQVFVLGAAGKQTPVTILQDSTSLVQVLSTAGGIDATRGKDSGILVFRMHPAGDSQVAAKIFTLDLSKPEGMLLASEFEVEPRDVVYVKETAFAQYNSVITQLLPTVTAVYQSVLIKCFASLGTAC